MTRLQHASSRGGQTMVEAALVLPLFVMLLFGIVTLGLGVFYQQQVTNAAREAARYAAVNSATAQCPTSSSLAVNPTVVVPTNNDVCPENPTNGWPTMTSVARNSVFGLDRSDVNITACWSGYWQVDTTGVVMPNTWDAGPINGTGQTNAFLNCTVPSQRTSTGPPQNVDPRTGEVDADAASPGVQPGGTASLACPPSGSLPQTTTTNDTASNLAWSQHASANEITVYVCYLWRPPMAGFLLIPSEIPLRAVITEKLQHQK